MLVACLQKVMAQKQIKVRKVKHSFSIHKQQLDIEIIDEEDPKMHEVSSTDQIIAKYF